uniref:Uncharacterized protein n=1 Tax=Eutreptiella gymnastica TaxID=73025 RepID=A0A7S4CV66_9EUGL
MCSIDRMQMHRNTKCCLVSLPSLMDALAAIHHIAAPFSWPCPTGAAHAVNERQGAMDTAHAAHKAPTPPTGAAHAVNERQGAKDTAHTTHTTPTPPTTTTQR